MKRQAIARGVVAYGLPGLVVGVILACALNARKQTGLTEARWEEDANRDGKVDQVFYTSHGLILRAEYDRNFDGVFDLWYWYSQGIVTHAEGDDNFDGKVDTWDAFLDGQPNDPESRFRLEWHS